MAQVTVTKFSDYIINSIEFFISRIETELDYRDLPGLSNGKVEIINVTKEHPLVSLMASRLSDTRDSDLWRSNILPAISVTPGSRPEKSFTLGKSLQPEVVNETFIDALKVYLGKTNKEIQQELLITHKQIETIVGEYNRVAAGGMKSQGNEFFRNEEINLSIWSESPDIDDLLGKVVDSVLVEIQVGILGDDSKIRNLDYKDARGLTNFNYGRVLYGTEYNLTFENSYKNFKIYTDDVVSGVDFYGTYKIPGEA
jgi:hypothetical protein